MVVSAQRGEEGSPWCPWPHTVGEGEAEGRMTHFQSGGPVTGIASHGQSACACLSASLQKAVKHLRPVFISLSAMVMGPA